MLFRTALVWLMFAAPASAASVSSHYTCLQGHEQDATAKLQTAITDALTNFFSKRRIAIDPTSLQVRVTLTTQTEYGGRTYAVFTGSAGGDTGYGMGANAAAPAATDGTKFNVIFSSGSDTQDAGEYRILTSQRGFDKEGNPIDQHCRLKVFNSGDGEASKSILVLNAASGRVLGLISLPAQISALLGRAREADQIIRLQSRCSGLPLTLSA